MKFWVLTDVETKYVSNIDVYLGAQEKELRFGAPLAVSVVVNLCKHIKRKGYNITCNNFFTSSPVAEKLTRDKLSIVGTMRKNRRELCKKMIESENKATYSTKFYWHDPSNFLFVKYQAKEKKSVCLLSSMQDSTAGLRTRTRRTRQFWPNSNSNSKKNFLNSNLKKVCDV